VFAFQAGAGSLDVSLTPANRAPNADLELRLLNSAGNTLTTQNPAEALNATLSYQIVSPGTYYLMVKGTGKGDVLGTGYSNYGSVGLYGLAASFASPGGNAPVASFTASATSGTAPVQIQFNGSASSDSDGTVQLYDWDFGDGTTSTGVSTFKVFNVASTYNVQLQVTDNDGMNSTTAKTITVTNPVVLPTMRVYRITMRLKTTGGNATATGAVRIFNGSGLPVSGASVAASWSGIVSGTATAVTDAKGLKRGRLFHTNDRWRDTQRFRL
jgi:PKD repeat protein